MKIVYYQSCDGKFYVETTSPRDRLAHPRPSECIMIVPGTVGWDDE